MTHAHLTHAQTPAMTQRTIAIDLTRWDVPHPSPFVCDIVAQVDHVSRAVEHVSNIEFVRWLDRAAEMHSDALRYTREWFAEHGMMWFVARHEIDYLAEVFPADELIIATWVRDMHKVKSWRDYIIARPSDGAVVCRAATLWVLVDLETRRPKRIDPDMAARFLESHIV